MNPRTLYVVSFRYSSDPKGVLGGDAAFLNQLLPHLKDGRDVVVLSLLHKGAQDSALENGTRVIRFGVEGSSDRTLLELHDLPEPRLLRMGQSFAAAAFHYIRKHGKPGDACLLNDFVESGDLDLLRNRGMKLIQVCHVLASEYLFKEYMADRFSGEAEDLKKRIGALVHVINAASKVIRTHKQLVKFFELLISRNLAWLMPSTIILPFIRERQAMLHCDVILAPTQTMKDKILECYPIDPARVLVHPWCVEAPPEKTSLAGELDQIREEFGIRQDDTVLLTLSRISPEKGIEFLLDALALLETTQPELASRLVLLVCGRPVLSRGERYFEDLQARASRLSKVRVHFPGFVTGSRKSAFFYSADIYIMPSKYESFGLSLLEAMAHGAAVLAAETDGSKDLVEPAYGTILPFESIEERPAQIAQAITELCARDTEAMGTHARAKSLQYRWPELARTILQRVAPVSSASFASTSSRSSAAESH